MVIQEIGRSGRDPSATLINNLCNGQVEINHTWHRVERMWRTVRVLRSRSVVASMAGRRTRLAYVSQRKSGGKRVLYYD